MKQLELYIPTIQTTRMMLTADFITILFPNVVPRVSLYCHTTLIKPRYQMMFKHTTSLTKT